MGTLIYFADDERAIRETVSAFLESEGYEVLGFESGDELYGRFLERPCDLVILDVMMGGSSGFDITKKLRAVSPVPIILLTARDSDIDYATGINLGADDYFTKPFSALALVMRVKAILRRVGLDSRYAGTKSAGTAETSSNGAAPCAGADLTPGADRTPGADPPAFAAPGTAADPPAGAPSVAAGPGFEIDENLKQARWNGRNLALTPMEYHVLVYLFRSADRVVPRNELLGKVWGLDSEVETRACDDTVRRLRKKLDTTAVRIETVWGFGFQLKLPGA